MAWGLWLAALSEEHLDTLLPTAPLPSRFLLPLSRWPGRRDLGASEHRGAPAAAASSRASCQFCLETTFSDASVSHTLWQWLQYPPTCPHSGTSVLIHAHKRPLVQQLLFHDSMVDSYLSTMMERKIDQEMGRQVGRESRKKKRGETNLDLLPNPLSTLLVRELSRGGTWSRTQVVMGMCAPA